MHFIEYSGSFAFMKPFSAVKDIETRSNLFLTPSILMGIEHKIFDEINPNNLKIKRHRLQYDSIEKQQEKTKAIRFNTKYKDGELKTNNSIICRWVLVNPTLFLGFDSIEFANIAYCDMILLSRNEDILLPVGMFEMDEEIFNSEFSGNESKVASKDDYDSVFCGLNKYLNNAEQYITCHTF